ncbi:ABC transporter ATP-binding protein [Neotabrizicola sp. VNH66]|uniref:ABC transporter ATP-binding protein n=1 Tax=Neotabrizicola sp. VNH66 TaxID=3400918 RepID=UPI003C060A43
MTDRPPIPPDAPAVIEARDLKTHFQGRTGIFSALAGTKPPVARALDGVDLRLREREIVGLVGESGCGKSTLGMTLVRMYQPTGGQILYRGAEITAAEGRALKDYRRQAQIIFQDPYSSLNPRLTIGQIIEEPLVIHGIGTPAERRQKVIRAMDLVRIPAADNLDRYPSDLSGGQRQRIAIARALVLEPKFIVADEPVSMLDVSIQASVLELLDELSRDLGLAVLYISHDIATVGYICNHVAVMYLGRIVEEGRAEDVLARPLHPYTQRLMAAIPRMEAGTAPERVELRGDVPSPMAVPPGCRFSSRCPYVTDLCRTVEPELAEQPGGQRVRCHIHDDRAARAHPELTAPRAGQVTETADAGILAETAE